MKRFIVMKLERMGALTESIRRELESNEILPVLLVLVLCFCNQTSIEWTQLTDTNGLD